LPDEKYKGQFLINQPGPLLSFILRDKRAAKFRSLILRHLATLFFFSGGGGKLALFFPCTSLQLGR
jgi:hypothetical protein